MQAYHGSLPWLYVQLVEYHRSLHDNGHKLINLVGDHPQQFLPFLSVVLVYILKETRSLFDFEQLVPDEELQPSAEVVHNLAERVMLKLEVLVQCQEFALVLVRDSIKWKTD